jgi:hypothetical protein
MMSATFASGVLPAGLTAQFNVCIEQHIPALTLLSPLGLTVLSSLQQ